MRGVVGEPGFCGLRAGLSLAVAVLGAFVGPAALAQVQTQAQAQVQPQAQVQVQLLPPARAETPSHTLQRAAGR